MYTILRGVRQHLLLPLSELIPLLQVGRKFIFVGGLNGKTDTYLELMVFGSQRRDPLGLRGGTNFQLGPN